MSVLKSKRTESKAEYVNVANAIYIETINFLTRISARYSRLIAEPVAKLAGEVKDFDPKKYMDPKAARRMEPFSQYAVAAAGEAIAQAGLDMEKEDPFRVGTSIGSGIGSLQAMEREHKKMLEKGPNRVNPLLVPMMIRLPLGEASNRAANLS